MFTGIETPLYTGLAKVPWAIGVSMFSLGSSNLKVKTLRIIIDPIG
jgi:hypothetical protein